MSETKMSEVLVHGVDAEPAREKEAVRRVSRIFLTRSKSADKIIKEILAGKNPADIKFITAKWIEKDEGSENPRQLMPAGGKIKPDETAEAAAIREALEETHLRAADVEGLGNIRYSFHHKKSNQELTVDETLFIGKILPSDVAYPLDPKEDKIAGFHDLDVDELAKLFEKGQINKESVDHALHLLGHLNVKDSEEKKDPKEVQIVLDKFIKKMRDKEIDKKKSIFKHLLGLMVQNDLLVHEGAEYWLEQFSIAGYDQQENEDFIRRFWEFFGEAKEIVPSNKKDASLKQNLLCRAVDLSNFEEEIESANKLGSNIEATIRSIYALLEAKYYSEHYLQIMAENEKMKGFVGGLTRFSEAISSGGETLEQ
ncbi:MAG: NUDIX domain-containing protein, partial [bacterium]